MFFDNCHAELASIATKEITPKEWSRQRLSQH
jgi:hypothetical protein